MSLQHLLRHYPGRRISTFDGMTVTAEVWQEAHEHHRYHQRMHDLNLHGVGIVSGLEVIASEPASQTVYILPGVAVDPAGNLIVVPEPAAYDLGRHREGVLHMLLTYDESQPQPLNGQQGDAPFFVFTGYSVETVVDQLDSPQVELARIHRRGSDTVITDAADFRQPGVNEIDLRFRPEIHPLRPKTMLIGVAYLSPMVAHSHGAGLDHLARAVSRQPEIRAWVNDDIPLTGDLDQYTLICLAAKNAFELDVHAFNSLHRYVNNGGVLLLESCHREGGVNPGSDASFRALISSLGVEVETVTRGQPLLAEPFLFSQPPPGYETQGQPVLQAGGGVIFSSHDYACLLRGDRRTGPAAREEIRAAVEWGHNLLIYAWNRRAKEAAP